MAGQRTRRVILARFRSGGVMAYFAPRGIVEVDDRIVVETNKKALITAVVIQIEGITKQIQKKATKWIVQKIDMTEYNRRQYGS